MWPASDACASKMQRCCCYLGNEENPSDMQWEPAGEYNEPEMPKELWEVLEPHPEPEMTLEQAENKDKPQTPPIEGASLEPEAPGLEQHEENGEPKTRHVRASSQDEADALGSLLRDLKQLPKAHTNNFLRSGTYAFQAPNSQGPSLQCLHEVLELLWPKVNTAVERFMTQEVEAKIQNMLPGPLRSFCFRHFKLGNGVPEILEVEVSDTPSTGCTRQGVELRISFNLQSEVAIVVSMLGLAAGLSYLSMKGSAVIRLEPLLNELPVVGGIVMYFVDPPQVDFRMNWGPAQVSEWPPVKRQLQSMLDSVITSTLLLPNVIHVPLVDDEDVVDTAALRDIKPLGILRVMVTQVSPIKKRLSTRWPQVKLELGAEEWICPATTSQQSCCWPRKQPRGRIFVQVLALTGLSPLGTYLQVQMGQQSYRTDTATEDSLWSIGIPVSFEMNDESLRLEVHRADNNLWHRSIGFVDVKAGQLWSLTPGVWCSRSERLQGAEQVTLQFELRCESAGRRNSHDFFVHDWNQKLSVSLRDLSCLVPATVAVSRPRKVFELLGQNTWKVYLSDPKRGDMVQETHTEVELSLDWLETLPDPLSEEVHDCLVECHFDEVYVSDVSFVGNMLAMRACIGETVQQTRLAQRGEQSEQGPQGWEFKVESILRLPVSRSVLETEGLKIEGVDGRGNVCAMRFLQPPRQLMSQELLQSMVSVRYFGLGSTVHKMRSMKNSEKDHGVSSRGNEVRLDWVNQVWRKLHPKIVTIAARQLEDPFGLFTQALRLQVPLPLKDVHFTYFMLGNAPPEVGPFEVSDWHHPENTFMGIEVKAGFHLDTEAKIEMKVRGLTLGVNRIVLKGDLLLRLVPVIEEIPVVGGIVASFLNPPEVQFEYSGLAQHMDSSILRRLLQAAVGSALVFPRAVTIPVGTEEQNVDRAQLDPPPIGVLRIWVLRAADLPSSWPLGALGAHSRSPYMSLSLSPELWQTSVVFHSTNPQWNEKRDFLVFDRRQELEIQVVDNNSLFLRNVIAVALPIPIHDLAFGVEEPIPLFSCKDGEDGSHFDSKKSPAGTAYLRFEWLNFVRKGRRGADPRHLLRVKFDELGIPNKLLDVDKVTILDPAFLRMRAKVGEVTSDTPGVAWSGPSGRDHVNVAEPNTGSVEVDLEHTLYLLINAVDLDVGELELQLMNKYDQVLGMASIKLSDVLAAVGGGKKWSAQDRLTLKNSEGLDCFADVDVSIHGLRLAQECVAPYQSWHSPSQRR
ncbi:unnamed protein product [Durusdinium trenchii]|uniref:Uncharacterized protein n=1 Tax=Durusdinium trenchii TaxID=1381693 RepID=A0ABP0HV52_9DINO